MAMHAPIMGAVNFARPFKLTAEERAAAERSIEALIALLDAADGGSDIEDDGDEMDTNCAEDEPGCGMGVLWATNDRLPGCPISDPAEDSCRMAVRS